MNQCEIRGKAMSEFSGVNKSGHDFIEVEKRSVESGGDVFNIQVLRCNECGYISEGWIKL